MSTASRAHHLLRFVHHDENVIRACAETSPRVAQLAHSFPLLFALLAARYGASNDRAQVVRHAALGRPLKELASHLRIPLSLRNIPPEGCPNALYQHDWTPEAAKRLRAFIPSDPKQARCWLEAVFFAARLGGEETALWMARQTEPSRLLEAPFRLLFPLIFYAWASQSQTTLLGTCQRWTPEMSSKNAIALCQRWTIHLDRAAAMGAFGIADPWVERQTINKHELVPLTTIKAIAEEAKAWENCLLDYVPFVADDTCRLFSIRKQDQRVAVIEVTRNEKTEMLQIAQIQPSIAQIHERPLFDDLYRIVEKTPCPPKHPRPPMAAVSHIHLQMLLRRYRAFVPASEHDWISKLTSLEIAQDASMLMRWQRYSDDDHRFEARVRAQRRLTPMVLPRRP